MKSIKNLLAVVLVLFSGLSFAEGPGCDQYTNMIAATQCNQLWVNTAVSAMFKVSRILTRDSSQLGITQEEKNSVLAYITAVEKDTKTRCGQSEYDCQYNAYATGYQELKAFEAKKTAEKQARVASVARPSFTPGKTQVAVKPSGMSQAEIARRNEEEVGD